MMNFIAMWSLLLIGVTASTSLTRPSALLRIKHEIATLQSTVPVQSFMISRNLIFMTWAHIYPVIVRVVEIAMYNNIMFSHLPYLLLESKMSLKNQVGCSTPPPLSKPYGPVFSFISLLLWSYIPLCFLTYLILYPLDIRCNNNSLLTVLPSLQGWLYPIDFPYSTMFLKISNILKL